MIWFWQDKPLSPEDREIRDSIVALKTLRFREGRVSVDPSEVLDQPGYLDARRQAADLIHGRSPRPAEPRTAADWARVDALGMDSFVNKLAESLQQSRCRGLSLAEALDQLRYILSETST